MNDRLIRYRNTVTHGLYTHVLKPIFFAQDPEKVHDRMVKVGSWLGAHRLGKGITKLWFGYQDAILKQDIYGIRFENPIGLSAGFDKNGELTEILPEVGFGFAEIGSITGEYCSGNSGTRLWRIPTKKGLVVYYGLKNDGCEAIAQRLHHSHSRIPIGISVAATNCEATQDIAKAIQDMKHAFVVMEPLGAYLTLNISCPNTITGQPFLDPDALRTLLTHIDTVPTRKPIFIKLSPDMSQAHIDTLLEITQAHRVHGIICTNLTKDRSVVCDTELPSVGGMSGKMVQDKSDALLAYVYQKTGTKFVLVGSGGVFSAEDAYRKIRLGASLVQLITGMVFEGPQVISEINRGLVALLRRDGFTNIRQAVGVDHHA